MHIETEDNAFTILTGDCYIIPSQIYSKVYSDPDNPHSMIWVNCRETLIDKLFKIYFDKNIPVICTCNIEGQLKRIAHIIESPDYENKQDEITLILHKIILMLKNSVSFKTNRFDYKYCDIAERIS